MTMDIKDFYLNTPMAWYKYMRLKLANIPANVIEHYNLKEITTPDGHVYCEIQKGMYGLPQAGIIAQELLADQLRTHGYTQSKTTPIWLCAISQIALIYSAAGMSFLIVFGPWAITCRSMGI